MKPAIDVVAAILADGAGRVLITQRPAGKALAGWWEFPGGKLEPDEDAALALRRELREELGIEVLGGEPLMTIEHDYPERRVRLRAWRVHAWAGEPRGCEGQALRWLAPPELMAAGLLPADEPIAARLTTEFASNDLQE